MNNTYIRTYTCTDNDEWETEGIHSNSRDCMFRASIRIDNGLSLKQYSIHHTTGNVI